MTLKLTNCIRSLWYVRYYDNADTNPSSLLFFLFFFFPYLLISFILSFPPSPSFLSTFLSTFSAKKIILFFPSSSLSPILPYFLSPLCLPPSLSTTLSFSLFIITITIPLGTRNSHAINMAGLRKSSSLEVQLLSSILSSLIWLHLI